MQFVEGDEALAVAAGVIRGLRVCRRGSEEGLIIVGVDGVAEEGEGVC